MDGEMPLIESNFCISRVSMQNRLSSPLEKSNLKKM